MQKFAKRLKIIEAIPRSSGQGQEKTILEEFLKMEEVSYESLPCVSFLVDNRYKGDNLKNDFLKYLFIPHERPKKKSLPYRYIHISSHGDGNSIFIGSNEDVEVTPDDMRRYCVSGELPLRGALITLSACGMPVGWICRSIG